MMHFLVDESPSVFDLLALWYAKQQWWLMILLGCAVISLAMILPLFFLILTLYLVFTFLCINHAAKARDAEQRWANLKNQLNNTVTDFTQSNALLETKIKELEEKITILSASKDALARGEKALKNELDALEALKKDLENQLEVMANNNTKETKLISDIQKNVNILQNMTMTS